MTNPEPSPKKSRRGKKKRQDLLDELESRRQEAVERFSDLRRSVDRELGLLAPRRGFLAVPVVAFACGLAVAWALRRKR